MNGGLRDMLMRTIAGAILGLLTALFLVLCFWLIVSAMYLEFYAGIDWRLVRAVIAGCMCAGVYVGFRSWVQS